MLKLTQVVMIIIDSDKQTKKSIIGLPFSAMMASVTPRNTCKKVVFSYRVLGTSYQYLLCIYLPTTIYFGLWIVFGYVHLIR